MPQALLYVTMAPRPGLAPARFHEWYNNEHGPLRLRIPAIFRSGTRYRAADGLAPAFLAAYDVADAAQLQSAAYTTLRERRSPREAAVIGQTDVRRGLYELVAAAAAGGEHADDDGNARAALTVAAEVALVEGPDELAARRWFGELTARMPSGWLRSRLFRRATGQEDDQDLPYLVLHDFSDEGEKGADIPLIDTDERYVAAERRRVWRPFYVFGPAPRDLESLSRLEPEHSFASADGRTTTTAGPDPAIDSYITTPDGLVLPYRLEGNPSPDAPVVAFANSLLTSLRMWDPLVAVLAAARPDLRFLRYDARGRHAPPPGTAPASLHSATTDLLALLDALRIDRLHLLVGVSVGGVTAVAFALQHPRRLAAFIACDFNSASSPDNVQAWRDRIALAEAAGMPRLAERTVARWFHPDAERRTPDAVSRMRDMVALNDLDGLRVGCTVLWDYDLRALVAAAGCEIRGLLVAGSHDANGAIARAMEGFAGVLLPEGLGVRIVPETGHLPMVEDPAAFWAAIQDFV